LVDHVFAEAKRLGLQLYFQNCGGWATSGGPWVSPDQAMKKLAYGKVRVKGPQKFSGSLPRPIGFDGYYRDVVILAYAQHDQGPSRMPTALAGISCDNEILNKELMADENIITEAEITVRTDPVSLTFKFQSPFRVSSLFLKRTNQAWEGARFCGLSVSPDNREYRDVFKENPIPNQYQTIEFAPIEARFFKLTFSGFDELVTTGKSSFKVPEVLFLDGEKNNALPALDDLNGLAGYQARIAIKPKKVLNGQIVPLKRQEILDLSAHRDAAGVFSWDVPPGQWTILRVGYTLTGKKNEGPPGSTGFESDKLSKEATREYYEGMKNVLFKNREAYIGQVTSSLLIDSWECKYQNWTELFPQEFEKRRGYSIYPWLPVIAGELVENDELSYRFLWDFRRTIADLIGENYFGEMARLCRQNGLKLEAEASGAQQAMKDPIYYPSQVDIPMTEFWVRPFKPNGSFLDAVSSGHLYDKAIISAESFTSPAGDWRETPAGLKAYGDKVFCWGINGLKFHSYTHQADETYPGWQMNPWGIALNRKMPWWEHVAGYFKYLQRAQHMLRQGKFAADVLLFYSEGAPTDLNYAYGNDVLSYVPKGYKFDGCDRNTLLHRLVVKDKKLCLPNGAAYRLLVLPESLPCTPVLLAKIKDLVDAGATLYGPKPIHSPSLTDYPAGDKEVKKLAEEIWGKDDGRGVIDRNFGRGKVIHGKSLESVLKEMAVPDFEYRTGDEKDSLDFIHRTMQDGEIYFVSNQESHPVLAECHFRVNGKVPELWDPGTGTIQSNLSFEQSGPRATLPLRLTAHSSVFVVFKKSSDSNPIKRIFYNGQPGPENYSLSGQTLEVRKPGKYRIEYTREEPREFEIGPIPDPVECPGPWKASFDKSWGGPGEVIFSPLVSWTERPEEGIRYYSGKVPYEKDFCVDETLIKPNRKIDLDLGEIRETARVSLNGREIGTLWKPPYIIEISGFINPGRNTLHVEVANTWVNRIVGDWNRKTAKTYTWSNSTHHYNKDSPLSRSGLIGPVFLRFSEIITISNESIRRKK
jgi:hypothetical protein